MKRRIASIVLAMTLGVAAAMFAPESRYSQPGFPSYFKTPKSVDGV
jgi:hypothetical protein